MPHGTAPAPATTSTGGIGPVAQATATLRSLDPRALVGSALLWSWVDALYMGSFFAPLGQTGLAPELATWGTFACVAVFSLLALARPAALHRALAATGTLVAFGVAGTAASLLFALATVRSSWGLLAVGALLGGAFMGASILGWGGVYCREGVRSASLYVAGGFACSLLADVTFSLMTAPASALIPATLPLLASLLLACVDPQRRTYTAAPAPQAIPASRQRGTAARIAGVCRRNLGVSFPTACSLALVMFGLGYMQHCISFAPLTDPAGLSAGASLQVVRGAAALILFAIFLLAPRRTSLAYRAGLLVVVAGFSLMPLLYGSDGFWVSGAVILAGYTTFDVLVWVIVAQAAYTGLGDPFRLVCTVRLLVSSLFCVLGGCAGIALAGIAASMPFANADAVFVGYLITVAAVLVSSSRDVWDLFDARRPNTEVAAGGRPFDETVDALADTWGLTNREREVFALLAVGRTQPWIAENLGISENTVGSHVRHVYIKAGVNNRQDLIDLVFCAQSPDCRESVD